MSETREKTSIELEFEDIDSKNLWAVVYQVSHVLHRMIRITSIHYTINIFV